MSTPAGERISAIGECALPPRGVKPLKGARSDRGFREGPIGCLERIAMASSGRVLFQARRNG